MHGPGPRGRHGHGGSPAGRARPPPARDQRAANQAAEHALALAEQDRVILPFAMTGSAGLLEALPRHQIAHAALLADILDVLHGASPAARQQSSSPPAAELSQGELRVLRYLPTNSGDDNVRGGPAGSGVRGSWPRRRRARGRQGGRRSGSNSGPGEGCRTRGAGGFRRVGVPGSQCASRRSTPASSVPSVVSW